MDPLITTVVRLAPQDQTCESCVDFLGDRGSYMFRNQVFNSTGHTTCQLLQMAESGGTNPLNTQTGGTEGQGGQGGIGGLTFSEAADQAAAAAQVAAAAAQAAADAAAAAQAAAEAAGPP